MKQSILSKMILGALLAGSLGMTACAKKDDSTVRVAGRGGAVTSGGGSVTPENTATCSNGQTGTGTLQATNEAILALVSATISPESFQGICKKNFSASLKFDSSGNVVSSGSSILIQIVDALVGQVYQGKTIQAYEIQFANAVSGMYNRNTGSFQVTFADSYGSFVISGQVNGANATGSVYFQNNVAVAGYSPVGGTLGTFTIPTAVLIK
ncbi:hypothetical protein [Bdellovibrio svalbardensis]|uniref:Lipoprotein n=1 Tax=Bdellovibrio svalbardensis TaxID=2972972 RepID=A0ABT6DNI1_9BACT|nr:hypothetical protein [Bdellovibrio svalbardensis]MDG0818211.1 hypothetical protein [Bdellovibrio svalbardensis]